MKPGNIYLLSPATNIHVLVLSEYTPAFPDTSFCSFIQREPHVRESGLLVQVVDDQEQIWYHLPGSCTATREELEAAELVGSLRQEDVNSIIMDSLMTKQLFTLLRSKLRT